MPHIKLRFSSQLGHPDLLYSQEWVNVIFLHLGPQKLYRAFRFGTLWRISCSYPRHSQLTRHSLMLANGHIRQSLTALVIYFGLVWTLHWCQMLISIHWARERCNHFTNVISKHMLWMQLMSTSCEIALRWMPKNTFDLSQHWFRLWLGATCALMCFNELNHWQ